MDRDLEKRLEDTGDRDASTFLDVQSPVSSTESALHVPLEYPPEICIPPEAPAQEYDPPPNGGLEAWLQVVGSFLLFFNTWYGTCFASRFRIVVLRDEMTFRG